MEIILEIEDLSYRKFDNLNLSFNNNTYYSIIGPNNSGKTTLFKIISGIIPTTDVITCNNIELDRRSVNEYIVNLGVVERVDKNSFVYKKVLDEMMYPLLNLGYSKNNSLTRINEVLELFNEVSMLDKYISELNYYQQQLLLIMIAILHKPKVLLLDSVLEIFPKNMYDNVIGVFNKLLKYMAIISFTNSSNVAYSSDKIIVIDNYKIIGEYSPRDIYDDDKIFTDHGIEIPFMQDLSIKLKMYNVIDKEYFSMKEMVDDIWP